MKNALCKLRNAKVEAYMPIEEVKMKSIQFFTELFKQAPRSSTHRPWFPRVLIVEMNNWLTHIPSKEEVKATINKMNEEKSLGPNSFTIKIFKVMWRMIKKDVIEGLTHLYLGRSMVHKMNSTFLTLITKVVSVENLEEFHHVSCVNTIYKLHTKILVDRLAMVVPDLLSTNQGAFTKGRQIANQFCLAREMIHSYGKKSTLLRDCMSIDLQKTFDSINWEAIDSSLESFGCTLDLRHILR